MIDRLAWFGLGACVGGVAMAFLMSDEVKEEDRPRPQYPADWPQRSQPQDKKRKPGLTISIDPRKKTDQPLVKLEWEKKNK